MLARSLHTKKEMDIEKYIEALKDQPGINTIQELVSECNKHPLPPGWEYEFSFPELVETKNGFEWRSTAIPVQKYKVEPPKVDLEREAVMFCIDNGINITPRNAKEIARHFYELGKNSK